MRYIYVHLLDFFLHVTAAKLVLLANDFSGSIPPVIGLLTNLEFLNLGSNDFVGSIPDQICALRNTSLSELYADCTNCPNGTAGAGECCNICFGS